MTSEEATGWPLGPEDREIAQWLAGELQNKIRFNYGTHAWHVWNGVIWAPDKTHEAERIVFDLIRDRVADVGQKYVERRITDVQQKEAFKLLRLVLNETKANHAMSVLATIPEYKTDGADWDTEPWLVGFKNGIVDLRTGRLISPDPTCKVTKSTRWNFDPDAYPRRLVKFLDEITSGDHDLAVFFMRWFGYSLFGLTTEQRFLILLGQGRNGKGALVHTMKHAFGDYAPTIQPGLYMKNRNGSARSNEARMDLMGLKGARLAIMSEPEGGQFNEELLKAHTGGDPIVARPLYGREIEWEPTHTITFLTNKAPRVDDIGPSMQARVMVADFWERYDKGFHKPDLRLYETLEREVEGVLALLVKNATWWWNEARGVGIPIPKRITDASAVYINNNDPLGHALASRFVLEDGARVQARAAYEAYLSWHHEEDEADTELLSLSAFGLLLKARGIQKKTGVTGVQYKGMRLKAAVELAA